MAHAAWGAIGVDMGIEARTRVWGVAVGMVGIGVSLRVVSVAWQMWWALCPVFVRLVGLRGGGEVRSLCELESMLPS
jgi:hypothetical protein